MSIRKAVKEDCKEIRRLIQNLAAYEKVPIDSRTNAKVLEEDGFGAHPYFQCLVIDHPEGDRYGAGEKILIGYSIYCYIFTSREGREVYMDDLYISPEFRGKGLGTKLWQHVIKDALSQQCLRCNFHVLDWNKPSIEFYKSKGAIDRTTDKGWLLHRMNEDAMNNFQKSPDSTSKINDINSKFFIRKATKEDCNEISRLIGDLADYEKKPKDAPRVIAHDLEKDGFGDHPYFQCLVIDHPDQTVNDTNEKLLIAYCLYYFTYATYEGRELYMANIYVSPEFRGKGLGTELFQYVVKDALSKNCARLTFSVLDWNKASIEFYKSKCASDLTKEKGALIFTMDENAMKKFVQPLN